MKRRAFRFETKISTWKSLRELKIEEKLHDPKSGTEKYFIEQRPEKLKFTSIVKFDNLVEVIEFFPLQFLKKSSQINELSMIAFNLQKE